MPEFLKIAAPSLKELCVMQLEELILSGKLAVGEALPPERELAAKMQVSRSIVNGGLRELERKGFLTITPRVGATVADFRREGNLDTLVAIMQYNGGRLRDDEVRPILEVRIALDTLIARQLIPLVKDEEVEELRLIVEGIRTEDAPAAIDAAFAFQHRMAMLSGNTLVPLIFASFKPVVYSLWARFCRLYGTDALYANNRRLWEHIRDRDADAAAAWIAESIGDSIEWRQSHILLPRKLKPLPEVGFL